jgi:DNA-binding response OmpR family regulator
MDVLLGSLDGREICKKYKFDLNNTKPVVLISGTHRLSQVMDGEGAPNAFLPKPFDIDQLLICVKEQLNQPNSPSLNIDQEEN